MDSPVENGDHFEDANGGSHGKIVAIDGAENLDPATIAKIVDELGGEDDSDRKCRNCGEPGHIARECDKPRQMGACFNCGQTGHNKAECPNPRVFTGNCRICDEPGHPAAQCPKRPPVVCKNCKEEGHLTVDCTNNRADYLAKVRDLSPEDAWNLLKEADADKDFFLLREAIKIYAKAVPDTTFAQLERAFRNQDMNAYIIALKGEESKPYTAIDLQGKLNCEYQVQFALGPRPKRKAMMDGWPQTAEENMERLENAGFVEERGLSMCTNCGEMGHISKFCKEEKREVERPQITCINCGEEGHRVRDCTQERVMEQRGKKTCRNCNKPGHRAADCTEPRSAEGVECNKCNEMGHFAKDCPTGGGRACRNCGQDGHIAKECPEPRNNSSMTCRNCGQEGHMSKECTEPRNNSSMVCHNCSEVGHASRDCPKPRDWSKVTCKQCGETGHTVKRCPKPKEDYETAETSVVIENNPDDPTGWGNTVVDW